MNKPCTFCEEARRRMRRLAAIVEAWARSRTGVNAQTAAAIDAIYREQYRNVSMTDGGGPGGSGDNDAHNYDNQT